MIAVPALTTSMLAIPAPTPAPTPSAPVEAPRDRASGIGSYITKVEGEMAKAPENRKGAREIPCTRENGFFFYEPGMKCIGFN